MTDPLATIREIIRSPADRVRWACLLEATAPKAGNVYPGASFHDLCFADFVAAADAIAPVLGSADPDLRCGLRIYRAVEETRTVCDTNVNLGMILLLAPLVIAETYRVGSNVSLGHAVENVLADLTSDDAANVYAAIGLAGPGGLDERQDMDVRQAPPSDLLAAMRSAANRDRIAKQYADGFRDLLGDRLLGTLRNSIAESGNLYSGIRLAQIRILADQVDSLIARKCGKAIAMQTQDRAGNVLSSSDFSAAWLDFDAWLRADGHRRNPGTTADLIAASLWCLLGRG